MTFKTVCCAALVAAFSITASTAVFAGADCPAYPKHEWINQERFEQALVDKGFSVKKFKVDDNCYELYGTYKNGQKVEIYFNPKTGKVVKTEFD